VTGRLYGVGVGPGDPELLTLKAVRIVRAAPVVAFFAARHGRSTARAIVADHLVAEHAELKFTYPITTEPGSTPEEYDGALHGFYDTSADAIGAHLDAGRDVAVLCEGDPFFYGSFMYVHDRLASRYATEIIPGVCSITAASARLHTPLARRDTTLTIVPGTLPEDEIVDRVAHGAAVIIKLGRNFAKVRRALGRAGAAERALYIERATMDAERTMPLSDVVSDRVPYFSLILVPEGVRAEPSGRLCVVGLGPGARCWMTPEVSDALADATDLVGYQPYLDRIPHRCGQRRHGSGNREELERAGDALSLADAGRRVCLVSSGDPGIFAMASAVFEAIDHGPISWRAIDVRVMPGVSAMQAAAARVGAPLGHDFCVLSLSDRLKPWSVITERLDAAARADLALALYNPMSSERPWQLDAARDVLARYRGPETPVVVSRDLGGPAEHVSVTTLADLGAQQVDMRTVILIGSSTTRTVDREAAPAFVYTPRTYRRGMSA
jgi:precorrin-2 C20-methyltransferase/precorrin-3B C17-methyltransferase